MDNKAKVSALATSANPSRAGPRVRPVPAVSRALAILRLLGRKHEPMGVNAIAQSLDMVSSTALHILRVLVEEGLVCADPVTKRYTLSTGLLTLARSVMETNTFVKLAQPALDRISEKWRLSSVATEIGSDHIVIMARSSVKNPYRLEIGVGETFPLLCGSTGQLVAAFNDVSPTELKKSFRELTWHIAPTFADWIKEVEATRTKGYSLDAGMNVGGIYHLAVPVRNSRGRVTHSLVANMVGKPLPKEELRQLAADMKDEANTIAAAIWEA